MTTMETRRYETLVRVHEFGQRNRERFPESSVGGMRFAAVAIAVRQLGEYAALDQSAARDVRRRRMLAREALVAEIDAIRRTARVLAVATPGLDERFPRPHTSSDRALIALGEMVGREAAAELERFVAHGLPPTFVDDLHARVEAFTHAIRHRESRRSSQAIARATIRDALAAGWTALRELEVIVANQLRKEPALLTAWDTCRRLEYPRRPRAGRVPPPDPAPPSPDAAAGIGGAP